MRMMYGSVNGSDGKHTFFTLGSSHTFLASYWSAKLGKKKMLGKVDTFFRLVYYCIQFKAECNAKTNVDFGRDDTSMTLQYQSMNGNLTCCVYQRISAQVVAGSCGRSEERRVGKECRSRRSP